MRRIVMAVCLAVAVAAPVFADRAAEDRLADLIRKTKGARDLVGAGFGGLASLPDFELDAAGVRRAIAASGSEAEGVLLQALSGLSRLRKRGDRIELDRRSPVTLPLGDNGFVSLGRNASLRARKQGGGWVVDEVRGLKVGESRSDLYDLWNVRTERGRGFTRVHVTAGAFVFSQTKSFDVPDQKVPASATPSGPRAGITSRLPGD